MNIEDIKPASFAMKDRTQKEEEAVGAKLPMEKRIELARIVVVRYRDKSDPWRHLRAVSGVMSGVYGKELLEATISV